MAIPVLIIGRSGTGKSTSLRNCVDNPDWNLIRVLNKPLALQKMKVQIDVCAEAKKVPQRCRLKMAEMSRMNNPNEFRTRMYVITEALSVTYAMICTELVTREKMSGAKICEFMNECTAFINDYLDGGWVCQEDIRYQLEKETGVKVALK